MYLLWAQSFTPLKTYLCQEHILEGSALFVRIWYVKTPKRKFVFVTTNVLDGAFSSRKYSIKAIAN